MYRWEVPKVLAQRLARTRDRTTLPRLDACRDDEGVWAGQGLTQCRTCRGSPSPARSRTCARGGASG